MTDQSISEQARVDNNAPAVSVAADEATMKRSIQMKMFATPAQRAKVAYDFTQLKSIDKASLPLGQIIGQIFAVKEKIGTLPDGSEKMSLLAIGDFEGVNYDTGETFTSTSAYLPGYYLETVQAILAAPALAAPVVEFALEIVLVPTGKSIPVAYEVRNLIRRRPDNRLNQIKAELQAAGWLRLSAPVKVDGTVIEGEVCKVERLEAPKPITTDEPDLPDPTSEELAEAPRAKADADKAAAKGKSKADA